MIYLFVRGKESKKATLKVDDIHNNTYSNRGKKVEGKRVFLCSGS